MLSNSPPVHLKYATQARDTRSSLQAVLSSLDDVRSLPPCLLVCMAIQSSQPAKIETRFQCLQARLKMP